MFYSVPATVPLAQLLGDALILASSTGHDVFNALDIFENGPVLRGAWGVVGCCCVPWREGP